jgi:hypothetical protein
MVTDGIMHIFGVGTPAEDRLSRAIRTQVITEAADAGLDLIFTYVWNFASEKGKANIDTYASIYEDRGGSVQFIELTAPVAERIRRADRPDRKRLKTHAPDAERVAYLDTMLRFSSPTPFFYPDSYTRINTAQKRAEDVAEEIIALLS